jgi:multiple sugar transport system substrate-binding protein
MTQTHLPGRAKGTPTLNRRAALATIAAFGVSPAFSTPRKDLHKVAASRAIQLAGARKLKLRLLVPTGTGNSIDVIIKAFQRATGIEVQKIASPLEDINTDLAIDHLSHSNLYDIALPATFAVSDLANSGAIIPVTDYANRYEPSGFRDGILYGSGDTIKDETYGFQADGDAYLMFYNNAMLDSKTAQSDYAYQHGTPLSWPQTWEELDRQVAFFHHPDEGQFGGLMFRTAGYVAWEWWVRLHAKGQWPFTSQMEPLIASDAGVSALEDMIAVTEYLHPDVSHLDLFSNWTAYAQGNTYANIGWGGSQKFFQSSASKVKESLSYGPTPGGVIDGKFLNTPYFNWGWTYVVTASCKFPEIAYLFNLFASSPTISTLSVRQTDGFFDPFRPEHYADPGIQKTYSTEFLKVHKKSLEHSIPDLYLHRQSDYFQTLGEWLYRALKREVAPKIALESVAQRWDAITRAVGKPQQIRNWRDLKKSYPASVRDILKEAI